MSGCLFFRDSLRKSAKSYHMALQRKRKAFTFSNGVNGSRLIARTFLVLSLLILTSCQTAKIERYDVDAKFTKNTKEGVEPTKGLLQRNIPDDGRRLGIKGGARLEGTDSYSKTTRLFVQPFRLAFLAVTPDVIMRRLAENTDIEYIADDQKLVAAKITLDISIRDSDDLYNLIDTMAKASNATVKWDGKKVYFTAINDADKSPLDGYLIKAFRVEDVVNQMLTQKYGVDCLIVGRSTVCTGPTKQLKNADTFLSAIQGTQGRIEWEIISTGHDMEAIVDGLGLGSEVVVTSMTGGKYMVASTEARYIDTIREVTSLVMHEWCEPRYFQPQNSSPTEVAATLARMFPETCLLPTVSGSQIVYGGVGHGALRIERAAIRLDRKVHLAKVIVLIANDTAAKSAGLNVLGWDNIIPTGNLPDAVQFSARIAGASGWRKLDITTDGNSSTGVQSSDRVESDLLITDGGNQVQGIENRTVGLSVQLSGHLTKSGYQGLLSITDSVLDGDITRSANCDGRIRVELGEVVQVCGFQARSSSGEIALLRAEKGVNSETFRVFAMLTQHETANLETLRVVTRKSLK